MTYTHPLPNGGTLTTEINPASPATIRAGLAEIERVAGLLCPASETPLAEASEAPPVSQVDIVTGEAAVAILERLRDLLGVASLGAVEAEVERMISGADTITTWPSEPLSGLWRYWLVDDERAPMDPLDGHWTQDTDAAPPTFVDCYGVHWFLEEFTEGERFTRIREVK